MKRLILCVEGKGDAAAVPTLVKRLLGEIGPWRDLLPDDRPIEVRSAGNLMKNDFKVWKRYLASAMKRRDARGVLLVLDGDIEMIGDKPFCPRDAARSLAQVAGKLGAGRIFSVAIVFACQEFETWLLAGIDSLVGQRLKDGRALLADVCAPDGDLEAHPRDAKGWLNGLVENGYNPARDQEALTRMVDLDAIRARELRSFRRLDAAVSSLREAVLNDRHIASPSSV